MAVAPRLSVTRRPTVLLPRVGNDDVVDEVAPVSVSNEPFPSRSHSKRAIEPSGSLDALPLNVTVSFTSGTRGVVGPPRAVNDAVGGVFGGGFTTTFFASVSVAPSLSRTSSTTVRVPSVG